MFALALALLTIQPVTATPPPPDDLRRPPPPPPRPYSEPSRPIAPISSYVTAADYPQEALRAHDQGTVGVRLAISADGRVTGCEITSSSGSKSLDQATCQILRSRAQFVPAVGWSGGPVPDSQAARIRWRLPDEPAPPG